MKHLILTSLAALTFATPVFAQTSGAMQHEDKMSSDAMSPKMTAVQAKTAKRCAAMSQTARAKNASCKKLAQAHPDAMAAQDDAMMAH